MLFGCLGQLSFLRVGIISILSLGPLMLACAAKRVELVPAATTTLASAPRFEGGLGQDAGVHIVAATNDWQGRRPTFTGLLRRCGCGHPLQISDEDFRLASPKGRIFVDLPPADIKGPAYVGQNDPPAVGSTPAPTYGSYSAQNSSARPVREDDKGDDEGVVVTPDFDFRDFYTAPYWAYGDSGLSPWPYAWEPDWGTGPDPRIQPCCIVP